MKYCKTTFKIYLEMVIFNSSGNERLKQFASMPGNKKRLCLLHDSSHF